MTTVLPSSTITISSSPPPHSAPAARWLTIEYLLYFGYAVFFFYQVFSISATRSEVYNVSSQHLRGLTPGSLGIDRFQDLSDIQWATWRSNFPLLCFALGVFVLLSQLLRKRFLVPWSETSSPPSSSFGSVEEAPSLPSPSTGALSEKFVRLHMAFYASIGVAVTFYLHSWGALWLYLVLFLNYTIAHSLRDHSSLPYLTWLFNVSIIFSSYAHRYRFFWIHPSLEFMDNIQPLLRWETYFKITMLRNISYNLDYHWSLHKKTSLVDLKTCSDYTRRQETNLPDGEYNWLNYIGYALYSPLYLAGPIVSFNSFVSQVYAPQTEFSLRKIMILGIRVLGYYLFLECFLHYCYYPALLTFGVWRTLPAIEVALCGYTVLNFMYFKFLVIWRFFYTLALFDGIEAPDNMHRCVNNNFTFVGFWRSWHSSLNKWTIRYLYVPLGGNKTRRLSIWLIFFFIGLWHDLWWRWVAWALLNCLFFSLEIIIMTYFSSEKFSWIHSWKFYRNLVAVVGSLNIFLLMIANLAILLGFEDSFLFLQKAFLLPDEAGGGPVCFLFAWFTLYVGVMLMQEIRAEEERRSQSKKF